MSAAGGPLAALHAQHRIVESANGSGSIRTQKVLAFDKLVMPAYCVLKRHVGGRTCRCARTLAVIARLHELPVRAQHKALHTSSRSARLVHRREELVASPTVGERLCALGVVCEMPRAGKRRAQLGHARQPSCQGELFGEPCKAAIQMNS